MAQVSQDLLKLEARVRNGSGWFFWIACLSLINSAVILTGGRWGFLVGLGTTELISAIADIAANDFSLEIATVMRVVAFCMALAIAGIFLLAGFLARRRNRIAYLLGIVLYLHDIIVALYLTDYPAAAFHVFALFFLSSGLMALHKLIQLERETPTPV